MRLTTMASDDEAKERAKAKARHPANLARQAAAMVADLRARGLCGSVSEDGFLCNLRSHTPKTKHRAEEFGGPQDGLIYAEWKW